MTVRRFARKTRTALVGGALATALVLTGCSQDDDSAGSTSEDTSAEESPASEETTEETTEADSGSGEVAAPGTTAATGEELMLPFTAPGGGDEAVIGATLTKVEKAPGAAKKQIAADVPQLKGMDLYFLWVDLTKASGGKTENSSIASQFAPVDQDKQRVQPVSLIGYDACPQESFSAEFDQGKKISTCLAAAVPTGEDAPAGASWGDFEDYNASSGEGLYWIG